MSHPLDENFFYNSMLAKALAQLLPPNERKIMASWFYKLMALDKTLDEKEIRNEYMWFILLMLQCQKIKDPFNSLPPPDIGPLRDIVSSKFYEEVLVANDDNMTWMEKPAEDVKKVKFRQTPPATFYRSQPTPLDGIVCYMSAFSDRGL